MFHNNNMEMKFSIISNKWNMLKTSNQATYPTDFCITGSHFYFGEKMEILNFLNTMNRIKFLVHKLLQQKVLY